MKLGLIRVELVFGLMAILCCAVPLGNAATNESAIPVVKFEGVDLITAIDNLARQADVNYLIDPRVGWKNPPDPDSKPVPRISITWTNLTPRQALKGLLAYYGMHTVDIGGTGISKITLTNLTSKPVDQQWLQRGTNPIIPLVQFSSVPLDTVLESLCRQAELTLILDRELRPPMSRRLVDARWTNITLRQAISALCENHNLKLDGSFPQAIRISRPDPIEKKAAPPPK